MSLTVDGFEVFIDEEDMERVMSIRWHVAIHKSNGISIRGQSNKKTIRIHNFITGLPYVDHINGNRLDNRKENLRPANHSENARNQKKGTLGHSVYKGAFWHKRDRVWTSIIGIAPYKKKYLGRFKTAKEAAVAYDSAAIAEFGEFARTNFGPQSYGRGNVSDGLRPNRGD